MTGLDKWTDFNKRILNICKLVWEAVQEVLCCDAPEGAVAADDEVSDFDIDTKDRLSYCWRALKESRYASDMSHLLEIALLIDLVSSLMHAMVMNAGYSPSLQTRSINCLSSGRLSLSQLAELRHRGAFSTVSVTFAECCIACSRSVSLEVKKEPQEWYQTILAWINQKASAVTRRSAGLPAAIVGVLAAYPDNAFFERVVLDLQAIADGPVEPHQESEGTRLPQVHALNCLKDVFTDARFGINTEIYMADMLDIAASCLESHV